MKVNVVSRSGRSLGSFDFSDSTTVAALKQQFQAANKTDTSRQWFTIDDASQKDGRLALKDDTKTLASYGVRDGSVLTFKDLGLQIGYRTVFFIEYFGPILVHALVFLCPQCFYGQEVKHTALQKIAFACVIFHYLKRELESAFVHRFSNDNMPFFNVFKNSFHYWILGGFNIAYFLYHPKYQAPFPEDSPVVWICVIGFVLCELGNLQAHLTLANLRPPGTKIRRIPMGGMFTFTACANYTYEVFAWAFFCFFTNTLLGWVFLVVSTGQIAIWALKKHQQYKKDFQDEYRNLKRKILFPFIW